VTKTILIVDDSSTTRALIRRTVTLSGCADLRVLEAANGREGLESARRERPDLILADLQMPEMNGIEMIRELMADPRTSTIPIAVVSAEPNQATIDMLRTSGVRAHLTKPFTPERMRALITEIMESTHA
jgi:two-component system, chemotaxis family, chemotaxis protein CheY